MENTCLGITAIQCLDIHNREARPWQHVEARGHHSLSFRISGKVKIAYQGTELLSEADMLTFVPGCTSYDTQVTEPGRMLVVHFETASPVCDLPHVLRPEDPSVYRDLFSVMCRGRDRYTVASHLYAVFARLSGEYGRRQDERLLAAIDYLEEHIADPDLSIKMLSDYAGVSEVYFRKLFHRQYGMQPVAYLKKRRIELAKALLSTGYYSVSEVGERCGFSFPSYFTAEFRKETGMTPSAYIGRE